MPSHMDQTAHPKRYIWPKLHIRVQLYPQ